MRNLSCAIVWAFGAIAISAAGALAAPIGATAAHVEGRVTVIHANGQEARVRVGDSFVERDTVKTYSDGVVEIEYDTGDLTRVDVNSTMVIKSLTRSGGSTFSIFGLVAGRIKSSVSKLLSRDSRFEYHTKSAVAGVAGTPPFVIHVEGDITNVDLLGAEGEHGSVYVQGSDTLKTMVMVMSGQRTIVNFGQAPLTPFAIGTDRFQNLRRTLPFKSRGELVTQGGGQEKQGPPKSGGGEKQIVTDHISSQVSTFFQPGPSQINTSAKLNVSTTAKQGAIGADTGAGVQTDQPPPFATGSVSITFQ